MALSAVYISKVRRLDENVNKKWNEINWSKYPISMGETIELCAGIIDKPNVSWKKHIQEEIREECGYNVNETDIQTIKTFVLVFQILSSIMTQFVVIYFKRSII